MSRPARILGASNHGALVEVDFDDGTVGTFHAIWLRDTCRCAQCRHPGTMRRVNESMLVDGYHVAEALRHEHPGFWTTLTETEVSFSYVDEEYDLRYRAPIIGLRRDGSYGVIRHAPGLLAPFDPRPARFARVYAAVHRFTEMLREPAYEIRTRLEPGELIAFDNVRVLHGRSPFDLGPGGRRHLLGCYIDIDDLHSRIRVLSRGRD